MSYVISGMIITNKYHRVSMVKAIEQSLVFRTGMAMSAVLLLAVVNMLVSFLLAESSENDAVRINLAGSLRMQSYRIAKAEILRREELPGLAGNALVITEVEQFELRLLKPVLKNHIKSSSNDDLKMAFNAVEEEWQTLQIKIRLQIADTDSLLSDIDKFVNTIDVLVKSLERQTENKFRMLRLLQGVSLLLAVIIASLAFYHIYYRVITPLRNLVGMASRVREGDFSMRIESKGSDELSLLAETFNGMVDSLNVMYGKLEGEVERKTAHLDSLRSGLRLLYETSRQLTTEDRFLEQLEFTVVSAKKYLQVDSVDIQLSQESGGKSLSISSDQINKAVSGNGETGSHIPLDPVSSASFPLSRGEENFGFLVVSDSPKLDLNEEQETVLLALIDTIVSAIGNENRHIQLHRLSLMEERAAIARELHDSLAQSLSYTKIQISRFEILQKKSADQIECDNALDEIRTGIQSAYRQLREVLATFRLQLDTPGLLSSLELTIQEFEQKGNITIDLVYQLDDFSLTPNEEIHVLQIIREALSNVIRHSGAKTARVVLAMGDRGVIRVSICDDGCGFSAMAIGPNHYGQTIMTERASSLGGKINLSDNDTGGACVEFHFRSERLREQHD